MTKSDYKPMCVTVYVEPQYAEDVKQAMLKAAFYKMNIIHEELSRHHLISSCTLCVHEKDGAYQCLGCSVLGNGAESRFEGVEDVAAKFGRREGDAEPSL